MAQADHKWVASIYDIRTERGGGVKNADKQIINIADKGGGGRKVQNKLWTSYMEAPQARSLRCSVFYPPREYISAKREVGSEPQKAPLQMPTRPWERYFGWNRRED